MRIYTISPREAFATLFKKKNGKPLEGTGELELTKPLRQSRRDSESKEKVIKLIHNKLLFTFLLQDLQLNYTAMATDLTLIYMKSSST